MSRARPFVVGAAVLVLFVGLGSGCAPSDACPAMCVAARDRFEACLDAEGLTYGESVGYESAADYEDWCDTFSWELRALSQADSCAARLPIFEEGTCADYHDAWEVE